MGKKDIILRPITLIFSKKNYNFKALIIIVILYYADQPKVTIEGITVSEAPYELKNTVNILTFLWKKVLEVN